MRPEKLVGGSEKIAEIDEFFSNSSDLQSKKKSASVKRLEASLYFLQWTKSALQAYTRTINELYLNKLLEHCTGCKVDDSNKSNRDEVERLANGPRVEEKSEHYSIRERLKEAAIRMTQWEGEQVRQGNKVCVAEVAAMHRLTQLIKASGSLLDIMERLHNWSDSNFQLICRHSISLDLMEHMLNMFNGTRCVAEIFHLMAVNLDQCKTAYCDYLDKSDNKYTAHENKELVIGEPRRYIPLLETQINHYRTIVYQLTTSLISILQTILRYVPQVQIDIQVRELKNVLDRIPPMYLKVEEMRMSKMAEKILAEVPPNRRSYPLPPKNDNSRTTLSGKSAHSGKKKSSHSSQRSTASFQKKKTNVVKSKYKNPLSASHSRSEKE